MDIVKISKKPDKQELDKRGVFRWPIWTKEISEFPWCYDSSETCYFLEGDVIITTDDGVEYQIGQGDLVVFPKGLSCTWKILEPVRKHYFFD